MAWADNKLTEASIHSNNGGEAVVQYANLSLATVKDSDGNLVEITPVTSDRISFNTEAGKTYTITAIPDNFKKIASTDKVDIAAYQVEGEKVWGVQFHPEMMYRDEDMLKLFKIFIGKTEAGRS